MPFERLSTRRVYAGRLLRVDCDRVRLPNGGTTDLDEMVRHHDLVRLGEIVDSKTICAPMLAREAAAPGRG